VDVDVDVDVDEDVDEAVNSHKLHLFSIKYFWNKYIFK